MPPEFRGVRFTGSDRDGLLVRESFCADLGLVFVAFIGLTETAVHLNRDQVEELHRRLGHWLAAQPEAPAQWEDL